MKRLNDLRTDRACVPFIVRQFEDDRRIRAGGGWLERHSSRVVYKGGAKHKSYMFGQDAKSYHCNAR